MPYNGGIAKQFLLLHSHLQLLSVTGKESSDTTLITCILKNGNATCLHKFVKHKFVSIKNSLSKSIPLAWLYSTSLLLKNHS